MIKKSKFIMSAFAVFGALIIISTAFIQPLSVQACTQKNISSSDISQQKISTCNIDLNDILDYADNFATDILSDHESLEHIYNVLTDESLSITAQKLRNDCTTKNLKELAVALKDNDKFNDLVDVFDEKYVSNLNYDYSFNKLFENLYQFVKLSRKSTGEAKGVKTLNNDLKNEVERNSSNLSSHFTLKLTSEKAVQNPKAMRTNIFSRLLQNKILKIFFEKIKYKQLSQKNQILIVNSDSSMPNKVGLLADGEGILDEMIIVFFLILVLILEVYLYVDAFVIYYAMLIEPGANEIEKKIYGSIYQIVTKILRKAISLTFSMILDRLGITPHISMSNKPASTCHFKI